MHAFQLYNEESHIHYKIRRQDNICKHCILKIFYYSIDGLVTTTDAKPLIQSSNFHKNGNIVAQNKSADDLRSKTRNIKFA